MSLIVIIIIAFGVLLFLSRTHIGRVILFLLFILFISNIVWITLFEKEPAQKFVDDYSLTIEKKTPDENYLDSYPWYASDEENFYVIYPGLYRIIPKDNDCSGFEAYEVKTWCKDFDKQYKCFPGEEDSCGIIKFR